MSIRALQDYTYYSKYARYNKKEIRRETWNEASGRVEDMHIRKYPEVEEDIRWAFKISKDKRVLGSQRALQFGGTPIEKKNARMYNCTVSFCDRMRFFQECFWLLLCGCGTGFSVQKHHIGKLPDFVENLNGERGLSSRKERIFTVPDTIEGWADSLGILLATYMPHPDYLDWKGCNVKFDFSQIRPKGAHLASGVGKAPGPEPLIQALKTIREMLDERVKQGHTRLRTIDAYDVIMHASDAVLSGGVRRSATICIFAPDDEDMINAKTGNWFVDNPQRARSNNSALLLRNETSKDEFEKIMTAVKQFGEPGFYFSDSTEQLPNPCFHKDTRIATKDGLVGIESLYKSGQLNEVVADNRAGAGDELNLENTGVSLLPASRVKLTQKNADIYEVRTKHGHSVKVTLNHEFPTTRGRLQLKDMVEGDEILLQSEEGSWGDRGSYSQGLILGMITGDGTFSTKEKNNKPFNEAFIDVWEDDFGQLGLIQSVVNDEIMELPSLSNGGRKYGCLEWVNQTTNETTDKNRIGGSRLYRFLVEVLGIENPRSIKNKLPECVWQGSREFVQGYLQGLFFADGSTQMSGHGTKATLSYRLNQSNEKLLQEVQNILSNFGIVSNICLRREEGHRLLPDGSGGKKDYFCKANYDLIMNRPNAIVFDEKVDWIGRKKVICESFWEIRGKDCRKPERFKTKIESIEYDSTDDVFCLKQPKTNTVIANGCVVGQCVEIGMWPVDEKTGESGWQFCNLCEINGKKIKSKEDFEIAAKAAAIIGTLQAGYASFDYLGKTTENIVKREALLGVSITGMQDNPDIIFDPKTQREMAKLVVKVNKEMAAKIGINPAARCTCVKPAGTTSCMLGSASGVHPHHARRYFRRVQANSLEPVYQYFKENNPCAVEKSAYKSTDGVITFCIEVPDGAKTKNDMPALSLLECVKSTYNNWVESGKQKELCTQDWLTHNVSNTINVRPEEWDEVSGYIYKNRNYFSGIALLPQSGDLDYTQAPMLNVHTPREILKMYGEGSLMASGLIVGGLHAFEDDLWKACNTVLGFETLEEPLFPENSQIEKNTTEEYTIAALQAWKEETEIYEKKIDWVRRVEQFAKRYCEDDVRKCTYLLKEVNNWKKWLDLQREYKDIDYTQLIEKEDTTKPMETIACAGGKCDII